MVILTPFPRNQALCAAGPLKTQWYDFNLDFPSCLYAYLCRSVVYLVSMSPLQWPERVIHCASAVTSLDFSADNPSHLAVGTYDGSVSIYNVSQETKSCMSSG